MIKKIGAKMISCLLILTCTLNFFTCKVSGAEKNDMEQDDSTETIIPQDVTTRLMFEGLDEEDLLYTKELYDYNDNVIAVLYGFDNGYFICDINGNLVEYSLENNPFNTDCDIYYAGPLTYYTKDDNDLYISLTTSEVLPERDIIGNTTYFSNVVNEIQSDTIENYSCLSARTLLIGQGSLKSSTRLLSYNPDGRCGAVAAAILLLYMYDNKGWNLSIGSYSTSDFGAQVTNFLMNNYFDTGSTDYHYDWGLVEGINNYLGDSGLSSHVTRTFSGDNWKDTAVSSIQADKPCILNLQSDPQYGNHFVVVTAYKKYSNSSSLEYDFEINDGHGNVTSWITTEFGYSVVYFN